MGHFLNNETVWKPPWEVLCIWKVTCLFLISTNLCDQILITKIRIHTRKDPAIISHMWVFILFTSSIQPHPGKFLLLKDQFKSTLNLHQIFLTNSSFLRLIKNFFFETAFSRFLSVWWLKGLKSLSRVAAFWSAKFRRLSPALCQIEYQKLKF